jgi:hypothetical protein
MRYIFWHELLPLYQDFLYKEPDDVPNKDQNRWLKFYIKYKFC